MAIMIKVRDTGEQFDVSEKTTVAQNIEELPLSDLSVRRRTYTNSIKLPATPKNKRILGILTGENKQTLKVDVYEGANLIMNDAVMRITGRDEKTFSVELASNMFDILEIIGDLTVGELLTETGYNHTVTFDEIKNGQEMSGYYHYFLCEFGNMNSSREVNIGAFYPMVNYKSVIDIVNDWLGGKGNYEIYLSVAAYAGIENLVILPEYVYVLNAEEEGFTAAPTGSPQNSTYELWGSITIKEDGRYSFILDAEYMYRDGNFRPGYNKLVINGKAVLEDVSDRVTVEYTLKKDDVINYYTRSLGIVSGNLPDYCSSTLNMKPVPLYRDFSVLFPRLKVRDVLLDIVQRTNSALLYEEMGEKQVLSILPTESMDATYDFTSKYAGNYTETYKVGNFKKKNYFRYRDTDRQQGEITVLDAATTGENTMITSVFGILAPSYRVNSNYTIASYPLLEMKDGTYESIDNKPAALAQFNPNRRMLWTVKDGDRTLGTITAAGSLDYRTPTWQSFINLYYKKIRDMVRYPRYATFDLALTKEDVKIPLPYKIWIQHLNSYYYVVKINNYIAGRVTRCEAIKM